MKINAYVIFDNKAKLYNKPFYFPNNMVALRACEDLANDPSTDLSKHPEDFSLWKIGVYDDCTANFHRDKHIEKVISFHEIQPTITHSHDRATPAFDPDAPLVDQLDRGITPGDEDIQNTASRAVND